MARLINSHTEHEQDHKHEIAIEVKGLNFSYSKKGPQILKNVNVKFDKGCFTTIIGPNGSGKSTLVKNIVKALTYHEGEITVDGKEHTRKEFAKKIAYIPQIIEIPGGISAYDFVSFGRTPYLGMFGRMSEDDHKIVEDAMKEMGTFVWKDVMTEDLSGGQRQKVLASMALAQQSDIVILDEPTTYLDIRAQYELLELMDKLHDKGKTVIVVLHDLNQAIQYSDEVVILKEGKVYGHGAPIKVVTEKMIKEVYGIETKLVKKGKLKYITDVKLV